MGRMRSFLVVAFVAAASTLLLSAPTAAQDDEPVEDGVHFAIVGFGDKTCTDGTGTLITGNTAGYAGGGLDGRSLVLTDSTIDINSAGYAGGGALISNSDGSAVAYALWKLEDRGPMFIDPGDKVYAGMIVGEHAKGPDLEINVLKGKQLTNIRAAGKDDAVQLTPPIRRSA